MSARRQTAKIREIIKGKCPTLSVTMGKGTARNWVQVDGSKDEFGRFTPTEKRCLEGFGFEIGLGGGVDVMPGEKDFFIRNKRMPKNRAGFKHW